MLKRRAERFLRRALEREPVVALFGPRAVGKTTLAREVARSWPGKVVVLDLERPEHAARLRDPERYLGAHRDALVVLDEVQRVPGLVNAVRSMAEEHARPGRFLLIGPAFFELSLPRSDGAAWRPTEVELGPLTLDEVGASVEHLHRLWSRGGFPDSFLASSDADSLAWRRAYVQGFLERDLPGFGLRLPPERMRRFWTMLAHRQGQLWNASEVARALDVSAPIAGWYAELWAACHHVRRLESLRADVPKRLVKAPKHYLRDSGLLHALLDVPDWEALQGHPIVGFSWEGFVIEQVLATRPDAEATFYRTATGVELDLVVRQGGATTAYDVRYGRWLKVDRALRTALDDLRPKDAFLVHPGERTWRLSGRVQARSVLDLPARG